MIRVGLQRMAVALPSLLLALSVVFSAPAFAELPPNVAATVEKYKVQLSEWAANPAVVTAVRASNAQGGSIPGMTNGKWDELTEDDPQVVAILSNPVSELVKEWERDDAINKLFVRDANGNLVAGSSKTLLYNAAARPPIKEALKGQPWGASQIRPDPTTQINSVHVSAPVLDNGQVIGVLHTAVTAE
jgi:hypothetical protein